MAAKREIPDLSNATPTFLVDQIGLQRQIQKDAKFLEGIYKQALDARRDKTVDFVEGDTFRGEYTTSPRESVNSGAVRADFPPGTHPQYYQVTEVTMLKTPKKDGTGGED